MDFLLSNPQTRQLHSHTFLEILNQYPTMMESIDSVLDVSCGPGADSFWWANVDDGDEDNPLPLNIKVTAIDTQDTFDQEFKHKNIKYLQDDIFSYNSKDTFDVMWAHGVLHQANDPLKYLHRLNQLTNMGGMLCLSFPTTINTFYGEPDYRVYSQAPTPITIIHLIHMLVLSGFNCNDGYFVKQPNTNIINALVYKDSDELFDYGDKTLYEYESLLPESCNKQLSRFGYLTNKGLLLYWIDGTLIDYSK